MHAEEKSILKSTLQWFLSPRGILAVAFWLTIGFLVLTMTDLFDTPAEKAGSEIRKCVRARRINMMADAERYCQKAMHLVESEKGMPDLVIARANSAAASLAMVQKRTEGSPPVSQRPTRAGNNRRREPRVAAGPSLGITAPGGAARPIGV